MQVRRLSQSPWAAFAREFAERGATMSKSAHFRSSMCMMGSPLPLHSRQSSSSPVPSAAPHRSAVLQLAVERRQNITRLAPLQYSVQCIEADAAVKLTILIRLSRSTAEQPLTSSSHHQCSMWLCHGNCCCLAVLPTTCEPLFTIGALSWKPGLHSL